MENLLTRAQVAELLGLSIEAIKQHRRRKTMPEPDVTYGRTPLWRVETIKAWRKIK
jgi:hypothetical protein